MDSFAENHRRTFRAIALMKRGGDNLLFCRGEYATDLDFLNTWPANLLNGENELTGIPNFT